MQSIVARAITILNRDAVQIWFAIESLSKMSASLGNEMELHHESGGPSITLPVKVDAKGILSLLMQVCFAVEANGTQGPAAKDCKIFVSEDSTKVEFIGKGRKRADNMYSGFSDIGAPEGHVFQLQTTVQKADEHALLQLADIVAYVCSHSRDKSEENRFFREQRSRFKSWFSFGPMA